MGLVCTCFGSPGLSFASRACVHFSWLPGCALCAALYAGCVCLRCHTQLPGPTVCAARVVCTGWVCMPCHSQFPGPLSVWVHGPEAVNGLRSAAFSVYGPPNPWDFFFFFWPDFSLPGFLRLHSSSLGPPVKGFPLHGSPSCFRAHSLPWGTSSCPEVLHPLPRSSLSFPF